VCACGAHGHSRGVAAWNCRWFMAFRTPWDRDLVTSENIESSVEYHCRCNRLVVWLRDLAAHADRETVLLNAARDLREKCWTRGTADLKQCWFCPSSPPGCGSGAASQSAWCCTMVVRVGAAYARRKNCLIYWGTFADRGRRATAKENRVPRPRRTDAAAEWRGNGLVCLGKPT